MKYPLFLCWALLFLTSFNKLIDEEEMIDVRLHENKQLATSLSHYIK